MQRISPFWSAAQADRIAAAVMEGPGAMGMALARLLGGDQQRGPAKRDVLAPMNGQTNRSSRYYPLCTWTSNVVVTFGSRV